MYKRLLPNEDLRSESKYRLRSNLRLNHLQTPISTTYDSFEKMNKIEVLTSIFLPLKSTIVEGTFIFSGNIYSFTIWSERNRVRKSNTQIYFSLFNTSNDEVCTGIEF